LATVLFTIDIGRVLFFQQYYTERARAAARAASVNDWDQAETANFVCYNSTTPPQGATVSTPGFLGVAPNRVTLTRLGTAGTPSDRFRVKISGIPMFRFVPFMSGTFTARDAVATAPVESRGATE
jgi:hypothetical protein